VSQGDSNLSGQPNWTNGLNNYLTILSLGLLLGIRHAFDADHLAAVSTIVSRHSDLRASGLIGLCWGLGHTAVLLVVGAAVLSLGVTIPEQLSAALEFCVGALLVWLGISLGIVLVRDRWHLHTHRHDGTLHRHLHSHLEHADHDHPHWLSISVRPTLVGMAHGLAGSAALLLIVLSTVPTLWKGLLYIGVFGLGSIVGMIVVGLLVSLPFAVSSRWSRRSRTAVQGLACFGSIALGLTMMIRIGLGFLSFRP
jgi:sulfite exporter TauE/SafE